MRLDRLATEYVHSRRGEITVLTARNVRSVLGRLADSYGDRPAAHLSRRDIERWQESLATLAPATRRTHWSIVSTFVSWLVEQGHVRRNPISGMRGPRQPRSVPRALPGRAVAAVLAACPDARARLIVTLMVQQGLRCCEVSALDLGDLEEGAMRVTGKGGHQRILPITEETREALEEWLGERGWWAGPLVVSYVGTTRLTPDSVSRLVGEWMWAAGVKQRRRDGISAHALRHTCATDMLRSGAQLPDVQGALGHASLATTGIYVRTQANRLAAPMGGRRYRGRHLAAVDDLGATRRAA